MTQNFTVNGTFIPQDASGNDMCILFMKYGRCRFKAKCKKSHWVPPLPDDPYPIEIKPPLPSDDLTVCTVRTENETRNTKYAPGNPPKEPLEKISSMPTSTTSAQITNCNSGSDLQKFNKASMVPRRFKHIFYDKYCDLATENVGVNRLFLEAGAYFDNVAQKLQISKPPQNKIEKRHLKVLRRIHWQNTQTLKQKLSQYPPSYKLKFDWSKIDLVRLRPYVYVLVHECLCVEGELKPSRPSSFEYLVADTLIAYLDGACMIPQEIEEKLRRWGARAVRARQCVDHLWHTLAISSNSPDGCAKDVIRIEDEVVKGSRSSLDYAHACAFALKRVEQRKTANESTHVPRKVSSSVKQGLHVQRTRKTKFIATRMERGSFNLDAKTVGRVIERAECNEEHVTSISERGNGTVEHAGKVTIEHAQKVDAGENDAQEHISEEKNGTEGKTSTVAHEKDRIVHGKVAHDEPKRNSDQRTKRKRSKQFKNVPFSERKRFKTRCLQLLTS
ncbi:uncharacterized protein LOC114522102 [Dendronephthya gigantea]|uniref:uncharacterized protein LOC114522102 n=1 Tax=Dendronephthya gigantea TaxID=151771 RepID=UPI00106D91E6|nr:uncharacterized protein LOC114522102 [Dendronephthya gigantea]